MNVTYDTMVPYLDSNRTYFGHLNPSKYRHLRDHKFVYQGMEPFYKLAHKLVKTIKCNLAKIKLLMKLLDNRMLLLLREV